MYQTAGFCNNCGAPMYVPSIWYGIYPPTPQPSCGCFRGVRQVQTFGPYAPSRSNPTHWDKYTNPLNQTTPESCSEECISKETTPLERFRGKQRSITEKIAETRKELEKIKARQKAAENNDLSGVESLGKALGESEEEERMSALETRMDRLENMMITTAQKMDEIKQILIERVLEERKSVDNGK